MIITRAMPTQQTAITAGQEIKAGLCRDPGVKAWGAANGVPVIYCKSGERKHRIAEEYLATHDIVKPGVFLVLAAKAPATIRQVHRSANGVIGNLAKKYSYVNHYSFHIMDPQWGHVTIKMSGHPPFAAQVMLCLLYTSDAADEEDSVDLGGRRI